MVQKIEQSLTPQIEVAVILHSYAAAYLTSLVSLNRTCRQCGHRRDSASHAFLAAMFRVKGGGPIEVFRCMLFAVTA